MRRIRPWVVNHGLPCRGRGRGDRRRLAQSGFLRESAANYLRERLAAEFGAQFQTTDLRGTCSARLSLGGSPSTVPAKRSAHGGGRQISFNPYAVLFGRSVWVGWWSCARGCSSAPGARRGAALRRATAGAGGTVAAAPAPPAFR